MSSNTAVANIPDELKQRTSAVVFLTGLDLVFNATHKIVWEHFSANRRLDRPSIHFRVVPLDHEYPKRAPQRLTYEHYVPRGILRSNWLQKHLTELPSVVAVFFDLDWDDPQWPEKCQECSTRLKIIRGFLDGRNTRVVVVLIQKNAPLPPGDDLLAPERAAALCSACDLNPKSLFALPHDDHLFGYIFKLESAFYEQAQTYYQLEMRRVKGKREALNKTQHQALFVRHQFKIAFYSQLKQDTPNALKNYKQAYANLMEVRLSDVNTLEVKTVAGFINHKICSLLFAQNSPLDAISHFRKHIDIFRTRVGRKDLAFEHYSWIAKQYAGFGDLFETAVNQGLAAVQTQHPGFYFEQAVKFLIFQKKACMELCEKAVYPANDPLVNMNSLDYYGQRPWRQGTQALELVDPQRENAGIAALQTVERDQVNHSALIISVLNNAINQFKKYKSERMKRSLIVQMAEEYACAKDYEKSLTLLSHAIKEYRTEQWWALLTNALRTAVRCAYLLANVKSYVSFCLELINKDSEIKADDISRYSNSLERILQGLVPLPEPNCTPEMTLEAEAKWRTRLTEEKVNVNIDMNQLLSFMSCVYGFSRSAFSVASPITGFVYLQSSCAQLQLPVSRIDVKFTNEVHQSTFTNWAEGTASDFLISNADRQRLDFVICPTAEDVNTELLISSVTVRLGADHSHQINLQWSLTDRHRLDLSPYAKVLPVHSKLKVSLKQDGPALIGDYHVILLIIENTHDCRVTNVQCNISLIDGDTSLDARLCVDFKDETVLRSLDFDFRDTIESGNTVERRFFLHSGVAGDETVNVVVNYLVALTEGGLVCRCQKTKGFCIPVMAPFNFTFAFMNMKFTPTEEVRTDEPFLLLANAESVGPYSILIGNTELSLMTENVVVDDTMSSRHKSQLEDIELSLGEMGSECIPLVANRVGEGLTAGNYVIHWTRKHEIPDLYLPSVRTEVDLPALRCVFFPLRVQLALPSHGLLRNPMPIRYTIKNKTDLILDLDVSMETSDAFMFAGSKQTKLQLLSEGEYTLSYNLYPLTSGYVALPRLVVHPAAPTATGGLVDRTVQGSLTNEEFGSIVEGMFASHIFIMPKEKIEEKMIGRND